MNGELKSADLRRRWDPQSLGFATTADVADAAQPVGQPRAVAALRLGAGIASAGYHVFALGAPGTPKREIVERLLAERAASRPAPPDLCYVHNFAEAHRPRLLVLPTGKGAALQRDMDRLIDELRATLTATFTGDDYRRRHQAIDDEISGRLNALLKQLGTRAESQGMALVHTPGGFAFLPSKEGEPMSEEEFHTLPEAEQKRLQALLPDLQEELAGVLRQVPGWAGERANKIRALDREVVQAAVGQMMDAVRARYADLEMVVRYLEAVQNDLVENARYLMEPKAEGSDDAGEEMLDPTAAVRRGALRRYRVNVVVDNAAQQGAPTVFEENPTYENLVGRVDYVSRMGTLVTDFTLIRAGALHRANGGYLVLDAHRLLSAPFAWEALKLALHSGHLRLEPLARQLGFGGPLALEPEPLALDIRVIVIGEPLLYYLLSEYDPEFGELFGVSADFADELDATPEAEQAYVRVLAGLARREKLLPLDAPAVAALLEESARLAGDRERLSMRTDHVGNLMREADYLARADGAERIGAEQVRRAVVQRIYRADRVRERMVEETRRGTFLIDTKDKRTGQVNGLSVMQLGDFAFGHPTRITARVHVGEGHVVDIEREVELGGPIHSKGVLILGAFLSGRYALGAPLSIRASLVFEQSYSGVEGDSASAAELCALLSAIAEVPLKQGIAVTGSVNQQGEIQPVGGINEKIEGFFDVCRAVGLTGDQGVLIPQANVRHLMLRQDVVDAVEAGRFHVYAMSQVDDAIERLSGMPVGGRDELGRFPAGSFDQLVELRLEEFAERMRAFQAPSMGEMGPVVPAIEVVSP
ncbi:MAG: AAA family ATPase [Gemmatimonadota bacterium]|nr:AAA family ATPase [Gemmatimonadota bacterium]